jgi:hypothetical protein
MSWITNRKLAVGAVGVLATVGVGGAAFATSGPRHTSTPSSSTSTSVPATKHAGVAAGIRKLLLHTDHASFEVKVNGTWETLTLDRGKVSAISATSITLARPDGQSVTDPITSSTKFRGVTNASTVIVGKGAIVISMSGAATTIAQRAGKSGTGTAASA